MRQATIRLSSLLLAAAFAAPLAAQTNPLALDVSAPNSAFAWDGTTNFGDIVGNPDNTFRLDGVIDLLVDVPGGPFGQMKLNGGFSYTVPNHLAGKIPNPIPFLPPLATIDIYDTAVRFNSASMSVNPATGAFTGMMTLTMIHGRAVVEPFGSTATTADLAGAVSDLFPVSGTLSESGGIALLHIPVNATFDISDPAAGFTGTFTLAGNLRAGADLNDPLTRLYAGPLVAGSSAQMQYRGGVPNRPLWLAASLVGPGSTNVVVLGVTLGLANPFQAGPSVGADANGDATWNIPVPVNAVGRHVWLQAAQAGRVSNVLVTTVL
ncbi:MAG TPA: hypothetical protein VGC54_12560 [Planctomycetota bacterium]